jgi:hypothetical protein
MGDRANITIIYNGDSEKVVDLYAHWAGSTLGNRLEHGIAKAGAAGRWQDEPYCARIILAAILGEEMESTTGFGIAPYSQYPMCEHPALVVDLKANRVAMRESDDTSPIGEDEGLSFAEVVELKISPKNVFARQSYAVATRLIL